MFKEINDLVQERLKEFDLIPESRKLSLQKISDFIVERQKSNQPINLVYICTHNSRRSQFGHFAAAVAAVHYKVENFQAYSGGMEETAFHPHAIAALNKTGFVTTTDEQSKNPVYCVKLAEDKLVRCFSKIYDHPENPSSDFLAIMVCTDADENCPFIPTALLRISTPYEDPKKADGTTDVLKIYEERFAQILRETLYAFSLI